MYVCSLSPVQSLIPACINALQIRTAQQRMGESFCTGSILTCIQRNPQHARDGCGPTASLAITSVRHHALIAICLCLKAWTAGDV
eukprot:5152384-Amphidinium_carterae.2